MDINELSELFKKGYGGRQLTSLYTGRTDSLLRDIFCSVSGDSALCLIAVGGYGRGELAPFSDIDIMLFARDRSASERAKELLYRLWDSKLDISYSFRTPADCISEAGRDIRTRTSLLEHRYIAGDINLYRYFNESVYPEIAARKQRGFVSDKLRETQMRHMKFGDSVYMLEPNIKDGRGGLRDIQTVVWLASVKLRIRHFDELSRILMPESFRRLFRAYDFMLKVRFCLHLLSGRKNDLLSFEFHERIADMLGFKSSKRFLSSERFMRYLYLKESVINDIASGALDIISVPYGVNRVSQDSYMRYIYFRKKVTEDFYISKDRIAVTDGVLKKDPDKIIEAFYVMSKTGKKFSPNLREEIRKNLFRISRKVRSSHNAIEWFLGIIRGERVYETLRELHDCGVLGRLIPEFGALSFLAVYELYHAYTVDEHTLHAIRNLLALKNTKYKSLEHLSFIFQGIRHKETLILSLLLHDIGKSAGGHHEEVGYRDIKNIVERFNLSTEMRSRIEFLVKNHTLMASVAFRREIDDPEVIAMFADDVADIESLDALYLLTYADMSAVNPDFWTDWKAYLLRDLYESTFRYLEGSAGVKSDSREVFWGDDKDGIERFLSVMPVRYGISTPPEKICMDYRLYLDVAVGKFSLNITDNAGSAEITVGALDSPGLFSRVVGVLSSMGMNIYRARIYTGKDGIVIDRIQVSNWKEIWWDGMAQLMESNLRKAVCGDEMIYGYDTGQRLSETGDVQENLYTAPDSARRFGPFIEVDNETSAESTVLEFFAYDRLGLLYDVASLMHEHGIDIASARINTESGFANDIFYIQKDGKKIDSKSLYEVVLLLWDKVIR